MIMFDNFGMQPLILENNNSLVLPLLLLQLGRDYPIVLFSITQSYRPIT